MTTNLATHTPNRPDLNVVREIVQQLPNAQRWPAALHLLTPVELHSPTHSTYTDGQALLGTQSVVVAGKSLAAGLALMEELVTVTAAELVPTGPYYLKLDAHEPFTWVKMSHTGAYIHAFGVPELFGSPHLAFTPDIPLTLASSIFSILASGGHISPGRLYLHGTPVWVEGDAEALRISLT